MIDLSKLDAGQRACAEHVRGPILVRAIAGAGKTTAIVHRIANLIQMRVPAARILAVTFSRKGAEEMNTRLRGLGISTARVGTIHSLAWEIVRTEEPRRWTIDDRGRYEIIVKKVIGYQGMRWETADSDSVCAFIGLCKAALAPAGSEFAEQLAVRAESVLDLPVGSAARLWEAYERAEEVRTAERLLTFDDQLVRAVELLDDDAVRDRWQRRYDYIIQDEAQDQNLAQARILEALAATHRNYMVVGDPKQCIYTWRGAEPSKLASFVREWDAKVVDMKRSYRCPSAVTTVANRVLSALDASGPRMEPHYQGGTVSAHLSDTALDEANYVLELITGELARGRAPRDIGVLYRLNEQSVLIEDALIRARIPYRVLGGISFFERKEVVNLLSWLRIASGVGGTEDVRRTLRAPFRYLKATEIDKAVELAKDPHLSWEQIADRAGGRPSLRTWADQIDSLCRLDEKGAGPSVQLGRVLQDFGFLSWLRKEHGEDTAEQNRRQNCEELVRIATRFDTTASLLAYAAELVRIGQEARRRSSAEDVVTLSTVHRAKGLEWPVVHVASVVDGCWPHKKGELLEELRLFYVAVTRAKDELFVHGITPALASGDTRPRLFQIGQLVAPTETVGRRTHTEEIVDG